MKIGYVGLGKMGKNMVLRLLENGIQVVAWNRSPEPLTEVKAAGAEAMQTVEELVKALPSPRIVWVMLPAGEPTQDYIEKLANLLTVGDLVIDGGNSFYKDTLARKQLLEGKGVRFVDIGVSGGPEGARNGACLMVGGSESDVLLIRPVLTAASQTNSWAHVGSTGSGHFAKMVHNGIEYGMMQAIAEGAAVLKFSPFQFNLQSVFALYGKGSVIDSKLIQWTRKAFEEDSELSTISAHIQASGEGEWTVNIARENEVEVPVIATSLQVRKDSATVAAESNNGWRNKVVSALRGQFGKHDVHLQK